MARYAENTTVSVDSSRGEITGILAKHGVVRMGWWTDAEGDALQFELKGGRYELRMTRPTMADVRRMYPNAYDPAKKIDAEWRRRWRANVLLLKAKLEFADGETSTVERELMPYMLLKDGTTLGGAVLDGKVPLLAAGEKA